MASLLWSRCDNDVDDDDDDDDDDGDDDGDDVGGEDDLDVLLQQGCPDPGALQTDVPRHSTARPTLPWEGFRDLCSPGGINTIIFRYLCMTQCVG